MFFVVTRTDRITGRDHDRAAKQVTGFTIDTAQHFGTICFVQRIRSRYQQKRVLAQAIGKRCPRGAFSFTPGLGGMCAPQHAIGLTHGALPHVCRYLRVRDAGSVDQVDGFQYVCLKINPNKMRALNANLSDLIQFDLFAGAVQLLHIGGLVAPRKPDRRKLRGRDLRGQGFVLQKKVQKRRFACAEFAHQGENRLAVRPAL